MRNELNEHFGIDEYGVGVQAKLEMAILLTEKHIYITNKSLFLNKQFGLQPC
jgi:hypothetical protein